MNSKTFFHQTTPPRPPGQGRAFVAILAGFVALTLIWQAADLITDWYWFQEVGYERVFLVTLTTQIKTALLFAAVFFALFFGNLSLARALSRKPFFEVREGTIVLPPWKMGDRAIGGLILLASLLFSVFAALQGAVRWESVLRFLNATPFGTPDPLFKRDIGFYVFQLPLLNDLYGWLMGVLIFTLLSTLLVYLLRRAFVFMPPRTVQVSPAARAHLVALVAVLFFLGVFGFWLGLSNLLFEKRGVVSGPGYTDVTTQVWVLKALMGVAALTGAALVASLFRRDWRIPAVAVLVFFVCIVVGRGMYPAFVQKFKVVPNEIVLEKPYLEWNIHYTRLAYNLDNMEDRDFPAEENLTAADLKRNDLTIKNIRLWNHAPLLRTYSQIQEIRTYYKFRDVDNDRYMVNGEYRQVMLSPRELSYDALPSRSWVNEHLVYTHGYGAVMGPVNRVTREGLPEFFIKDIPPVATTNVRVTRPEIYYDETSNEYVFVKTKRPEFDYPVGDQNVYARYEGKGGVPLNFWRKVLYAMRFGSLTILLSDDIPAGSRVMYHRSIRERVSRVAPFARFDADPYLVITPRGRIVWFVDGYTLTDRIPYSEPIPRLGNYIRNSLKAVVDAYDGTVQLYIADGADPIVKTYARIFPGIFRPLSEMPADLQPHVRYPQGMLSIQARMYRTYHMQDPQVFYNKEDMWEIPSQGAAGGDREMEPYYTIMKLPEGEKEEFILLLPFTPRNKDNLSAWMAARCDAPHYGKVVVYNFPKQKLIYGPRQIEARIDQESEISKQISLWNQSGSQVIRGSLLAIPIEKSILYVQSLYLAAEKGQLPELKRVIVAFGNAIAMEETLELSLRRIFGGGATVRERAGGGVVPAAAATAESGDRRRIREALDHYRKAQDHLRQGNWGGYGDELKRMADLLERLEKR
ncbi:MAG: UPF0182 family protein [Syntrophales bacterium]